MYEGKLRIPIRLKDRIEMLKNERGWSFNKMVNYILEIGLYEILEEREGALSPLSGEPLPASGT